MQPASPSSSTTTPSPSLAFLPSPPQHHALPADLDPHEREERQRAVKKFLARAECNKLTRGLRARLAYASYKASHNLAHVPLPVLETRLPPTPPAPAPTPKRAAMAPPPAPARSSTSTSLYAALLGPPPPKRARHVYGPSPSPAALLPSYTPSTPSRRKPHHLAPHGRTVRSHVTEKEDMNAAATLTALMFNRASPRQEPREKGPTEDADAAELMLYLATSPSPVRPPPQKRTPAAAGMGRVLFAGEKEKEKEREKEREREREATPGLTASQGSSLPSSQDTAMLLPPAPSPPPPPPPATPKKAVPFDVSRRLFVGDDGTEGGATGFTPLGKGIDLVEAK